MNGEISKLIKKDENRKTDQGGYGFVKDADGHDRFFHANDLVGVKFDQLRPGLKVEFEPGQGKSRKGGGNGLRAESVKVIA